MTAIADVAAAILPPEAGGPDPGRVEEASRRLIERMPAERRAGIGAALGGVRAASVVMTGKPLARLGDAERERVLERLAGAGWIGGAAMDALKTIVLMAAGAEARPGDRHHRLPARALES